jgi:hypothetical protein
VFFVFVVFLICFRYYKKKKKKKKINLCVIIKEVYNIYNCIYKDIMDK